MLVLVLASGCCRRRGLRLGPDPGRPRSTSTPPSCARSRRRPASSPAGRDPVAARCRTSRCRAWAAGRRSTSRRCAVRWCSASGPPGAGVPEEMPALQAFYEAARRRRCRCSASTSQRPVPRHARSSSCATGSVTYPLARRPGRRPPGHDRVRRMGRGLPYVVLSTRTASVAYEHVRRPRLGRRAGRPGPRAPRGGPVSAPRATEPPGLAAAGRGGGPLDHRARPDPVHAARGRGDPGQCGADALRRGRRQGPDLLLTERSHTTCARTRARCPSPAAPSTRARPPQQAALREAEEETGLDPGGRRGLRRAAAAVAPAQQLLGDAGARLVARAHRGARRVARRGARGLPGARSQSCATPPTGSP